VDVCPGEMRSVLCVYLSCHTTHTTTAERRAFVPFSDLNTKITADTLTATMHGGAGLDVCTGEIVSPTLLLFTS